VSLPRVPGFRRWVAAETLSTLGGSVSFFALGWAATGIGGGTAGLVLTAGSVPLAGLMLLGGVTADRWGIRRQMIACDIGMAVVMGLAALILARRGALGLDEHGGPGLVVTLCAISFLSGVSEAMRRPASGVFPRLFVELDDLPQVLATIGLWSQVVRIAGPAVGGALIGALGIGGAFAIDALTFALCASALSLVLPPRPDRVDSGGESMWGAIASSVRAARRTPGVPAALLAVVGLAASVLTLVMLAVPAFGHARDWGPSRTGVVSACWTVGGLLVTSVVARRGAFGRTAMCLGTVIGAGGAALLALAPPLATSMLGVTLLGVGTTVTTTRLIPVFMGLTPPTMLARFQALLQLAQTGATLVMMPVLGVLVGAAGPAAATLVLAGVLLLTTAPLLRVGPSGDHDPWAAGPARGGAVGEGVPGVGETVDGRPEVLLGPGVGDPDERVESAVQGEGRPG
jgi:MFS family permease